MLIYIGAASLSELAKRTHVQKKVTLGLVEFLATMSQLHISLCAKVKVGAA